MITELTSSYRIRFGPFEADLTNQELRRGTETQKLGGQPFQVLAMLVEHAGEVVTREELRRQLWPADTFVDFDHGLNTCINRIRQALADSAKHPLFVETLPKRGYRFIASVQPSDDTVPQTRRAQPGDSGLTGPAVSIELTNLGGKNLPPPTVACELVAENAEASGGVTQKRGEREVSGQTGSTPTGFLVAQHLRRYPRLLLGSLVVPAGVLLVVSGGGWRRRFRRATNPTAIQSLAVLPLINLSSDPSQEYFADGMTEMLITELTKIDGLRVTPHVSVMRYKATQKPASTIAQELGVDALIEGSAVRYGDRVRITVQLVQTAKESDLWAADYERDLQDILGVQSEIACVIAGEVELKLGGQSHLHCHAGTPSSSKQLTNPRG